MIAVIRRFLTRVRALFRSGSAEAELQREIAAHLRLIEDDYRARGLSAEEAQFAAQRAFGGVAQAQERQRETRSFRAMFDLGLDLKLGARMLRKHPGLTLVGGLGIAVAIGIGAAAFNGFYTMLAREVPLPEGERLVSLLNWRAAHGRRGETRFADLVRWREEVRSLESIGAFRNVGRNLVEPDGSAEPITIAEMTPAGFAAARVPALLGRIFDEQDARPGAPGVLVISHQAWQARFAGARTVLGREVRLGERTHTIVGVMPPGFAFPVAHDYWAPLAETSALRGANPALAVFGRLARGATMESAQAELDTVGERAAADWPETHGELRPRVMAYPRPFDGTDDVTWTFVAVMQLLVTMLQVVVCANVAILIYARTLTRQGELAVRTALGATRRRIVGQLFLEALVLAGTAAAGGLVLAYLAMQQIETLLRFEWSMAPFWVHFGLAPATYWFGLGLAVLGAAVCGLLPALKATGRGFENSLRQVSGAPGTKLGKAWTSLIVLQVAIAVAGLPVALFTTGEAWRHAAATPGFATDDLVVGSIALDPAGSTDAPIAEPAERRAILRAQLERRLRDQPDIVRFSVASAVPGDETSQRFEIDGPAAPPLPAAARRAQIDGEFLPQFGGVVLAGRALAPGDLADPAHPILVNRHFAEQFFPAGDALGKRLRFLPPRDSRDAAPGEWRQIVGVVSNVPANAMEPGEIVARVYEPLPPDRFNAHLLLRLNPGTQVGALTERLRALAAGVDPRIRVHQLAPLPAHYRQSQVAMRLLGSVVGALTLCVVLLSAAGIYAMMAFVVAQRRREIGIRAALGADPRQLVQAAFARAARQLLAGVALGAAVALGMDQLAGGEMLRGHAAVLVPVVAVLMLLVGLLAAVGPARRAVRIDPIETLRAE